MSAAQQYKCSHKILDRTEVHIRYGSIPLEVALVQKTLNLLLFETLAKILTKRKVKVIPDYKRIF